MVVSYAGHYQLAVRRRLGFDVASPMLLSQLPLTGDADYSAHLDATVSSYQVALSIDVSFWL